MSKSIFIGHPTMKERSGWVNPYLDHYFKAVTRRETRFDLCFPDWPTVDFSPVDVARNKLALLFLESKADFWLTIDNDTVPVYFGEWVDLLGLAELELDIVSAPCPIFGTHPILNVYKRVESRPDGSRYRTLTREEALGGIDPELLLREVDSVGFGAVMLSRAVALRLVGSDGYLCRFRLDAIGERDLGEDHDFCERAKENGFRVWASYKHICGHLKTVDTLDTILCEKDMRDAHDKATEFLRASPGPASELPPVQALARE